MGDTKPFISKGWLCRFINRFELKNIKMAGGIVSSGEEAIAIFPV